MEELELMGHSPIVKGTRQLVCLITPQSPTRKTMTTSRKRGTGAVFNQEPVARSVAIQRSDEISYWEGSGMILQSLGLHMLELAVLFGTDSQI